MVTARNNPIGPSEHGEMESVTHVAGKRPQLEGALRALVSCTRDLVDEQVPGLDEAALATILGDIVSKVTEGNRGKALTVAAGHIAEAITTALEQQLAGHNDRNASGAA